MKAIEIMKKNLKVFIRDKQAAFMLIFIPILFYFLMGVIFGAGGAGDMELSKYTLGYINDDLYCSEAPINDYQSIEMVVSTIQSNSEEGFFQLENFTQIDGNSVDSNQSFNKAEQAMIDEQIAAILVFESGFQNALNDALVKKIGVFNNDTSNMNNASSTEPWFYSSNSLLPIFEGYYDEVVNLSESEFLTIQQNFTNYTYDYLLVIENGYNANIGIEPVGLTFYHRESQAQTKHQI